MLEVRDLTLASSAGTIVRGASFEVADGGSVGLVGESGSGKTMIASAITGFLPGGVDVVSGEILYNGTDLLRLDRKARTRYHGTIAMISQHPRAALNPLMTVGKQINRALKLRGGAEVGAVEEALQRVGIRQARRVARSYPHELSGGMCQRVLISIMLACRPALLIADEPTTALDVRVQAEIFSLLHDVQEQVGSALLLITHDLGVVAQTSERLIVLYRGQVMEIGRTESTFSERTHPYTRLLIDAAGAEAPAVSEPGAITEPALDADACRFAGRCPEADERCLLEVPKCSSWPNGSVVYCHRREEALATRDSGRTQVL